MIGNDSSTVVVNTTVDPTPILSVSTSGLSEPKLIGAWYAFWVTASKHTDAIVSRVEFLVHFNVAWDQSADITCQDVGVGLVRESNPTPVPIACEGPLSYESPDGSMHRVVTMWAGWPVYEIDPGQDLKSIAGEVIFGRAATYTWFVWTEVL